MNIRRVEIANPEPASELLFPRHWLGHWLTPGTEEPQRSQESRKLPVRAGISTLRAGEMSLEGSDLPASFLSLLQRLGVAGERVSRVRQIHSRRTRVVSVPGEVGNPADGLLSNHPDAFLAVSVADCLPIFLRDSVTGSFGVVHSGWRGTGIVTEAVILMSERFGTDPADLHVCIGPGIGSCCYAVPEERARYFEETFGAESVRRDGGEWFLDLRSANLVLLRRAGVASVTVVDTCTRCTTFLCSYRRQGPDAFTCMAAFIGRL